MVLCHSNEKLDSALAMADLATQVHAVFAVAVARGGGGGADTPLPREPIFTDRARRKDLARWVRSLLALILSWILAGGEL
jgi:hypothetical protein